MQNKPQVSSFGVNSLLPPDSERFSHRKTYFKLMLTLLTYQSVLSHGNVLWARKYRLCSLNHTLGFHMTSPKFKLRNCLFFRVSTFTWYYSTLKPLYQQIVGSKGFFVLRHWTLEFSYFGVTRHLIS